ncbi:DUF4253 domain-containing protein [Massilia sp. TWP1-3-3]|uniref:DUF4253 domain-containing protein n=1 Tax=Massilia sp. TWP1-3-3 TaxID=2804573 RepID=UPI003CF2A361
MLTTTHVTDPDLNKAAKELLANANRLVFAGRFRDAKFVLELLVTPGPWMLFKHGNVVQQLERILPIVCYLCETGCPSIGQKAARSKDEIAAWAEGEAEDFLSSLAMPIRNQVKPAGSAWTEASLAAFAYIVDQDSRVRAFADFCVDAEFVLKERLLAESKPHGGSIALDSLMKSIEEDTEPNVGGHNLTQLLSHLVQVQVAEPARRISTATIGATTANYLRRTNRPENYMTSFIFQAVTILCLRDGLLRAAADAASHLACSENEHFQLIYMATVRPVRELFASGACASSVGVDNATVAAYLSATESRPQECKPDVNASPFMIDSIEAFTKHLVGTPLAGRKVFELPVLDTPEKTYAMETSLGEMVALWRSARALVPQTRRWPVITTSWGGGSNVSEAIANEDFFSRFYFEEAPNAEDVSPRALLATADTIDPDEFIKRMEEQRDKELAEYDDFDERIEYELEDTMGRSGSAPSRKDVNEARIDGRAISTRYQLDRWLLDWEQAHGGSGDPEMARQAWFEQEPVILLFLPTPNSWDALAYLNWYGASDFGSENYIALGRAWEKRFGAELFAHFGTMLECFVSDPPISVQEAWELAQEHDLAASCTLALPGITLRHYAIGLMGSDRWFLHERP